ncbi:putative threonylcarbamoyladenosine tRNA methylthiotransferase-like, partial [Triplophysa rosa]
FSSMLIIARGGETFVHKWRRRRVDKGVCEIWLTSEDTGAYGRDIGTDLPSLLWELVKEIPEGAMLRLGMTNPPYILEHLEEMAKILNHPRVYAFLHVPVQSASDSVLMDMRREYCCADFKRVVDFLKEKEVRAVRLEAQEEAPAVGLIFQPDCRLPRPPPKQTDLSLPTVTPPVPQGSWRSHAFRLIK